MGFSLSIVSFFTLDGSHRRALRPGEALSVVKSFAGFFAHFLFWDETAHMDTSFLISYVSYFHYNGLPHTFCYVVETHS